MYRRAIQSVVEQAYAKLLHAKQVLSLFMIAYGIVNAERLGIAAVGTAMARAFGKKPKHGTKQVDRCLSNAKLDMATLFRGATWQPNGRPNNSPCADRPGRIA